MEQGESSREGVLRASLAGPSSHRERHTRDPQPPRSHRHQPRHHSPPPRSGHQQQHNHHSDSLPCQACRYRDRDGSSGGGGGRGDGAGGGDGGEDLRTPFVMGMFPDRYQEAFAAHERAVFVEESRQRDRRRSAMEKGILLRQPWYTRIEYWAGIIGICAFVHQLFLTWLWPRFHQD